MNIDNVSNNSHIENVASENPELNRFMTMCAIKGIEFSPTYKDYTDERGSAYVSLLYNEKSLPLIYAIVALLRHEGYEFSFDKLNDKESAFNVIDVLNSKEDTKLFSKLNELISTYDVTKNYYYDLPKDLQKYFDICTYAHGDDKVLSNEDKLVQIKYAKKEEGHKYTIKTEDERYLKTADSSEFTLSTDDISSYEVISEDHAELTDKLDTFDNGIKEAEVLDDNSNIDNEEIIEIVEEDEEDIEHEEEKPLEEEEEKPLEEEEEKPEQEEPIKLDEDAITPDNGKFIDVSEKEEVKNEMPTPDIDMSEISRIIYDEPTVEEDHAMTL